MNDFQKSGKQLETIPTPVGNMAVPSWEAKRLAELSDEQVLSEVHDGAFIEPFAFAESIRRGIWRDERPQVGCTMADQLRRMVEE